MAGDGNFKWWWCRFEEMERCWGPHDSREAAIAAGRAEIDADEFDDGEEQVFYIVEADRMVLTAEGLFADDVEIGLALNAERILEMIADRNEEAWDEDGFEGLRGDTAEAEAELEAAVRECQLASDGQAECLNAAVADWLTRHSGLFRVFSFGEQRNYEAVPWRAA